MPRVALLKKTEPAALNSKGGRPTRTAAIERDIRLLDAASSLFLDRGFDATSINAVSELARVSKPTFYGQYGDKRRLSRQCCVERLIGSGTDGLCPRDPIN